MHLIDTELQVQGPSVYLTLMKNIPRGTVEKKEKQKNNDIYREKQINQHTKREFRWLCPVG